MQITKLVLLSAPAILAFIFLADVFDGNNGGAVRYDGETLHVDGTPYPRGPASGERFDVGVISLLPQEGKAPEVQTLLNRLKLTIVEHAGPDGTGLIVEVPMGFEQQWAFALSNFPEVKWTGVGDDQIPSGTIAKPSTASALQAPGKTTTDKVSTEQAASPYPPPPGEPSEADLSRLEFQTYNDIKKAGGMPVTVTATGKSLTLRPTLYSVRKESCKRLPHTPDGTYECSLIISLSLEEDGSNPSEQGERITVKWDGAAGEWTHY